MKEQIYQKKDYIDYLEPYMQQKEWSCGPASLVMMFHCFGLKYTEEQIIDEIGIEEHGVDWMQIMEYCYDQKFNISFSARTSYDTLSRIYMTQRTPILISWNPNMKRDQDHFSVLKRVMSDSVLIADPTDGSFVMVGKNRFLPRWYGAGQEQPMMVIQPRN